MSTFITVAAVLASFGPSAVVPGAKIRPQEVARTRESGVFEALRQDLAAKVFVQDLMCFLHEWSRVEGKGRDLGLSHQMVRNTKDIMAVAIFSVDEFGEKQYLLHTTTLLLPDTTLRALEVWIKFMRLHGSGSRKPAAIKAAPPAR